MGVKLNVVVALLSTVVAVFYFYTIPIFSHLLASGVGLPRAKYSVMKDSVFVETDPGILLQTDRYYPTASDQKFPSIVVRVPYGIIPSQSITGLILSVHGHYFASQGYNYVLQASRGKHGMPGDFAPAQFEKRDGKVMLAWLKKQPWFDGKLALFGFSIGAYNTVAQLGEDQPVQAQAVMPIMTPYNFFDEMHEQGAFDINLGLGWSIVMQEEGRDGLVNDYLTQAGKTHPVMSSWKYLWDISLKTPLITADQQVKNETISIFQNFIQNTQRTDDFWAVQDTREGFAATSGDKIHLITAWYDFFVNYTMQMYDDKVKQGGRPYLTVHAQDHFGLGENFDTLKSAIGWFDWKLKGDKKLVRDKPVAVQLMPSNEWREFDSWPPATSKTTLYLSKGTSSLFHNNALSGELVSSVDSVLKGSYAYTYNPENPTPIYKGNMLFQGGWGNNLPFIFNRLENHKDVLVFVGAALNKHIIVAGRGHVSLKVSSSIDYTDFFVRVLDYNPLKNESINVCEGFTRVSPSLEVKKSVDGSYIVDVVLSPTFYSFDREHRVVLFISSGAHPRYSRNTGTSEHIATATTFEKSNNVVYASSLSSVTLPILKK